MKFVSYNKNMYSKLKTIPWIKKSMKKNKFMLQWSQKEQKTKFVKLFGGMYIYLDLLFSVHTMQEKKRNSIVKKILSTRIDYYIRHSKQTCDLLEIPLHRVHYWCALATKNSYDLETELRNTEEQYESSAHQYL